jgi:hypothetical protein
VVRVTLFGTPRVERDGESIPLRQSKGATLLGYLAVTGVPQRYGAQAQACSEPVGLAANLAYG